MRTARRRTLGAAHLGESTSRWRGLRLLEIHSGEYIFDPPLRRYERQGQYYPKRLGVRRAPQPPRAARPPMWIPPSAVPPAAAASRCEPTALVPHLNFSPRDVAWRGGLGRARAPVSL